MKWYGLSFYPLRSRATSGAGANKKEQDEWCTTTHGQTGLTADVIASKTTPEQASNGLLEYIKRFVPERGRGVLAGNTVHCDKAFLRKQPYTQVIDHLHYRIFDVSSLKIAAGLWSEEEVRKGVLVKKNYHKAKEDILESIAEARYYKEAIYQRAEDV